MFSFPFLSHERETLLWSARVASLSLTALNDYQLSIGPSKWPDYLNTLIVPRIIDILEELSALSRSRRETELRARLQLIGGYLSLAMNDTQENSPSAAHANRRFLRTSLAAEGVSSTMRKSLTGKLHFFFGGGVRV